MSEINQMSNPQNPPNHEILQNLFNKRSPNTKYFSQSRIEQFNDSIAKQIINGDTVVSQVKQSLNNGAKSRYQEDQKKLHLMLAKRQKEQLQRKLSYVNKSIDSIKKYSYAKGQRQDSLQMSKSRSRYLSPEAIQELQKKDRQLTQSVKEHKERIAKLRQQEKQRHIQEYQENQRKQKKLQEKRIAKKKKEILQNMKKIKQQIQQREEQNKKSNDKIKQILHKKELYQKLQEQYQQKQNESLQERKRKLNEIRNFYKPIDSKQIQQHQRRVLQLRRQKQDIRQRQKKMNESSIKYKVPYMSSYYKQIAQMKKSQLNTDYMASSKMKIDKVKQFSDHVKDNFVPQISERKKRELEDLLQKQMQLKRLKQEKERETMELRKSKGTQYMQYLRKIPKKKRSENKIDERGSMTARPHYKNYIVHSHADSPHKTEGNWSRILTKKQLNQKDKAKLLQYESQKMEQHLKRKEQQFRLLKKDNQEDIDQGYYQMIKAKLDLLTG